jgi:hypothetical protein
MNQDLEHLRLLSVFHYVLAILAGLFSLFPLIYLGMGVAMIAGRFGDMHNGGDEMARFMGWFFVLFGAAWIVCGLAFTVCLCLAGRFLGRHQRYLFCLVMAGLSCMFTPFGTVLGVFTIIVLMRPSVKELFGVEPPAAASPAPL